METEAVTLAATAPASEASLWRRLDRIGSYILAGLLITVGVVIPMAFMLFRLVYGLFN